MNADVSARRVAPSPETGRRPLPFFDTSTCAPTPRGSRSLYGGFYEMGVGIELHDFRSTERFEWRRSFHPYGLELCLNLEGHGTVYSKRAQIDFASGTAGFYIPGKNSLTATRLAGERHRFITVAFSGYYLKEHLAGCDGALNPIVESYLRGGPGRNRLGLVHQLTSKQKEAIRRLIEPPVPQGARSLWYESQLLQLMVDFLFERRDDSELFCDRQKRLARERAEQVVTLLGANLVRPPSLEALARQVGCGPLYLCRIFFNETGMTIAEYLSKLRMHKASELLRAGKSNPAEAASAVGYSSLSEFTQPFCRTMGRCPALYPTKQDDSRRRRESSPPRPVVP